MSKPSLKPARWTPPAPAAPGRPTAPANLRVFATSGYGTEDVLVRADGQILTGVEDGRVLAIDPVTGSESAMAHTHGRPLGIEHHPDGGYIVCDSTHGLLHIGDDGSVDMLADSYDDTRFRFCNNTAVGADGTIFFTDSSTRFGFDHWRGDLLEHRPTGRLFRRDPAGTLTVLATGLAFANGVALAADESFVVVAETAAYGLQRLWLTGERTGEMEPFGPVLPGFPDNISTGEDGNIWIALASARDTTLDSLLPRAPWIRTLVWALPQWAQPQPKSLIHIQAYSPEGTLVHDIAGSHDHFGKPTGVRQLGDQVWMGSFEQTTIAVFDLP